MLLLCLKADAMFYSFSTENQSPSAKWLVLLSLPTLHIKNDGFVLLGELTVPLLSTSQDLACHDSARVTSN